MEILGSEIPFGCPVLHSLFDELSDPKSPFNLSRKYRINKDLFYGSITSFEGGYVPKYLYINGIEIFESTTLKDFNKSLKYIPKDILELPNSDIIIPFGIRCDQLFTSILGHFITVIIKTRDNHRVIEMYDPKKEDFTGKFDQIMDLFEECDLNHSECFIYFCATQKTEDLVNCGYYMFKIVYNYLLLTRDYDRVDHIYAVNPYPGERNLTEMVLRIIMGVSTDPYEYQNIEIDGNVINFLTLNERNYLLECIKRERSRNKSMV